MKTYIYICNIVQPIHKYQYEALTYVKPQTATGYIPFNLRPPDPQTNENRMPGPSNEAGQLPTQNVMFINAPLEYQNNEPLVPDLGPEGENAPWPPNANVITQS